MLSVKEKWKNSVASEVSLIVSDSKRCGPKAPSGIGRERLQHATQPSLRGEETLSGEKFQDAHGPLGISAKMSLTLLSN
jgi:hypothetical protein